MLNKTILLVCVLSLSLVGCTTVKRMTGQIDDTVLPGQRENVLPPDQTTARDPNITGGQPAPGGAIQQQALNQSGAPQTAQPGDLLPANNGTVVKCDPLVQTCPGMEPPAKPVAGAKTAVVKTPGTKTAKVASKTAATAKTAAGQPAAAQTAAAGTAGDAAAPQAGVTDPMKPVVATHKKKKIKKPKLTLKTKVAAPAVPGTPPAAPGAAPADPNAPAAPAPLVAPDAKTQ